MKRVKNVLSVVAILMVASQACGASSSDGEPIVGRHSFVINGPAGGASMGNGDVGVMLSGPADALTFYIGKNDSWGRLSQSAMAVGQMRIMTPALQGATLKTTVDMQHAELHGEYAKAGDAVVADVRLLGATEPLDWKLTGDGLWIRCPSRRPCDNAYAFQITLGGIILEKLEAERLNERQVRVEVRVRNLDAKPAQQAITFHDNATAIGSETFDLRKSEAVTRSLVLEAPTAPGTERIVAGIPKGKPFVKQAELRKRK